MHEVATLALHAVLTKPTHMRVAILTKKRANRM